MGPFPYWEAQLLNAGTSHLSAWGGEHDTTPQSAFNRLVALAKSNKTALVDGTFMIGDRLVLPRDVTQPVGNYAIPIQSVSQVCRFVSVFLVDPCAYD